MTFFRGSRGQQLFSPCFISFAQLRRVLQNPQQITVRIKGILLRRFNQAVDHGAGLCAAQRIGKQPVLPAHHKGLNAALGAVVAQLQTAILQIPRQIRPLLQQIAVQEADAACRAAIYVRLSVEDTHTHSVSIETQQMITR